MAFPTGWPPRPASGRRSIRVYISGTTTAAFSDNAYLFSQVTGANTFVPTPYVAPGSTATVAVGDLTGGGSPMGGGQNAHDVNTSAAASDQAVPTPMIWCNSMIITNDGLNTLEISFDGTNVHGKILPGETVEFRDRMEAGIALRHAGGATTFRVFAW